MVRYRGTLSALIIAFLRGLYLAIILDRYVRPHSALIIALHRRLYLAIMDVLEGPIVPLLLPCIDAST
jgi:hypothetical protein